MGYTIFRHTHIYIYILRNHPGLHEQTRYRLRAMFIPSSKCFRLLVAVSWLKHDRLASHCPWSHPMSSDKLVRPVLVALDVPVLDVPVLDVPHRKIQTIKLCLPLFPSHAVKFWSWPSQRAITFQQTFFGSMAQRSCTIWSCTWSTSV